MKVGDLGTFKTHQRALEQYNGRRFKVLRALTPTTYEVRLRGIGIICAKENELQPDERRARGAHNRWGCRGPGCTVTCAPIVQIGPEHYERRCRNCRPPL